jgi:uncharacterized membrane protein YeaQ/YmgE (transglycosylase-associated protein family)
MDVQSIVVVIVVGLIAGWLATLVVGGRGGIIRYIVIGLIGSVVGYFVLNLLHVPIPIANPLVAQILVSFIGAVILIVIARAVL